MAQRGTKRCSPSVRSVRLSHTGDDLRTTFRETFHVLKSKFVPRLASLRYPRAGSRVVRIDPLRFLAGCRKRRLNQALSVLSVSIVYIVVY